MKRAKEESGKPNSSTKSSKLDERDLSKFPDYTEKVD